MKTLILGGGLAGLSLAHFYNGKTIILEKEKKIGGLCRSFEFNKIVHDIGPHIIFSKNQTVRDMLVSLTETNKIKRSNKIFHKSRFVKYPFENELSALDDDERDYCLTEFLNNPYENYHADNMQQFFLKTFGEGITNTYLGPYNEKIWKFDPSFMDLQMVGRIPKPPKEDIIKSAKGISTEGYTHQLYFDYPKEGGIQKLITAYTNLIKEKSIIESSIKINRIYKQNNEWIIDTDRNDFITKTLINCMPIHELVKYLEEVPDNVLDAVNNLKYNSIHIVIIQAKKDNIGDNFALYFADKNIIFHRISKLNFLGENYCLKNNGSTILAEITFRPNSYLANLKNNEIPKKVIDDLHNLKLVSQDQIIDVDIKTFEYAYVIYDIDHRKNIDFVLNYLKNLGIYSCGRFAEFEYLNMDQIIEHSFELAKELI